MSLKDGLMTEGENPAAEETVLLSPEPEGAFSEYGPFAIEIPCSEENTRHWRHPWTAANGGLAMKPPILTAAEEGTVSACLAKAADKYPNSNCMGTRPITRVAITKKGSRTLQKWHKGPYAWRTYAQVFDDVQNAAKGLLTLEGIADKRKAGEEVVVALLAETSREWMTGAQAAMAAGITLTTVYATLGHEAMLHGLNETQAEIIFVEWSLYDTLKSEVLEKCPNLKYIIAIGKDYVPQAWEGGTLADLGYGEFPTPEQAAALPKIGAATTSTLDSLIQEGRRASVKLAEFAPKTDDLALIMYTSGSTGTPKGVELTHKNFVSVVASVIAQGVVFPSPDDVAIAYLPLAHILELIVEVTTMCQGAAIGYAHPRTLTASSPYVPIEDPMSSDLLALTPTLMAAVPAILDMICGGLKKKINDAGGVLAKLFNGAVARKMGQPAGCGICSCLDSTILGKVTAKLGMQNVRILISGGAPLNPETQEFVNAVFCPVAQGYGATETAGCATVQECTAAVPTGRPVDNGGGRVGAIQPASEIKLLSVDEMGYRITDKNKETGEAEPRGEILITGNNLARGYYKMPEKTAEDFVLHPDGKVWFHTGDVGLMCADGVLKIIDRKKDLIKLLAGEYVSLGKVEAAAKAAKGIGACAVFAQSSKAACVIIVSQPEKGWAFVGGKPDEATLLKDLTTELKRQKFAKFEIPTQVKVDDTIWTPESGLVTAAFKVARNPLRNHYNEDGGLLAQMDYQFPK